MRKNHLMSRIELGIYDLNTSAQTTEPHIPEKSQSYNNIIVLNPLSMALHLMEKCYRSTSNGGSHGTCLGGLLSAGLQFRSTPLGSYKSEWED